MRRIGRNRKGDQRILFKKVCCCINHAVYTENETLPFELRSRSYFFNRRTFSELLRRKLLDQYAPTVCTRCLDWAKRKIDEQESKNDHLTDDNLCVPPLSASDVPDPIQEFTVVQQIIAGDDIEENNDSVNKDGEENGLLYRIRTLNAEISKLKWKDLDHDLQSSLSNLAHTLGSVIRTDLDAEKWIMARECSSLENLINIDRRKWYEERNLLLRRFIEGCSGVNHRTEKDKKFNSAVHSIEQIMYTQNNNMVTPFAFQRNIISYLISKSRTSSTVMGSWESSGSYTKVIELLSAPSPPLVMPPDVDITITFDNEQKVGRHSGRIREGSKQPISIITTVATLKTNPSSKIQFESSPWKCENPVMSEIIREVNVKEEEYRQTMREYRRSYMDTILKEVYDEQYYDVVTEGMKDYIDISIINEDKYVCRCGYVGAKLFEVCPSCEQNTSFCDITFDKYSQTKSMHMTEKPEVNNAEPCMVNPASRENVRTVLAGVYEEAIITQKRNWVSVVCDGVPYVFAAQTQDEVKQCSVCFDLIHDSNHDEHSKTHIEDNSYNNILRELLVRPGPGHIEMNISRKLLNFLWFPFLEELATSFGFRTLKAKNVFRLGIDHHRSRQVLETCLNALSKELMVPYVRYCIEVDSIPTCEGLTEWYNEMVENKNYAFLYHVTFCYLLSFQLYNEAVRKNNSKNMMAARTTFAPLFYSGHHPKYQVLLLRDMCQHMNYTPEVSVYMTKTETFSVSGKCNTGQGADFIHEEVNKEIKSYLPPLGLPSKQTWTNIIRNASSLKRLKRNLLTNSGINFTSEKRSKQFQHEVTMVRRKFRQEKYLENYADASADHVSLKGDLLDHSLCDFNFAAIQNYATYKDEVSANGTYGSKKLEPIFITQNDREKYHSIEAKTIAEIKTELAVILQAMPNKDTAFAYDSDFKARKALRKHNYIALYYEFKRSLDQQLAELDYVNETFTEEEHTVDEEV